MSPLFPQAVRERRLAAYTAEWTAVRRSTEPADRERAERAIAELYAERGLSVPEVLWVPSPAAGVIAWHVASRGRPPVRNLYTRGEVGTGANREIHALDDPFGLEPAWEQRALERARPGLWDAITTVPMPWPRSDRLTFELPQVHVRAALERAVMAANGVDRRELPSGAREWLAAAPPDHPPRRVDPRGDRWLAQRVIGERWDGLAASIGTELLEQVALEGLAQAVNSLLDVRAALPQALRAMDMPQLRDGLLGMGLLTHVLGIPLWRLRVERNERARMVERRLEVARSVGAWWALEGLAICCERPLVLRLDEEGRPHSTDGPAIAYGDGFEVWADHGVSIPSWLVTEPGRLSVEAIDAERNAEVRRIMIERFGAERLVREGDATLVSEDETGRLWRRSLKDRQFGEEDITMVEVRNSTPEPDGSFRTYFLRVPNLTFTARDGVAWTFGLSEREYAPAKET
ncbi:MAG: hypothetical protein PVG27_07605 [Chloroflexota bacterium]|jgi:hypothetical protein